MIQGDRQHLEAQFVFPLAEGMEVWILMFPMGSHQLLNALSSMFKNAF